MKILHTSDIHLGFKFNKLIKEKSSLLKDEQIFYIEKLFEVAKDFDIVLICGDLFHSKQVALKILKSFFNAVINYGRPVVYISGNHDEKLIYNNELPENFKVLNKNNNIFSYEGINFFADGVVDIDINETNILLLHGNIENNTDNDYIDINKYIELGFDYIALGHIHQYKQFNINKNILAYSGSLFSNGFDECGDKGYISLEIEDKEVKKLEFVPFANRRFMKCICDISKMSSNGEIIKLIKEELQNIGATKRDIIRVELIGRYSEDFEKSPIIISDSLSDYFYLELFDNSTIEINLEKIRQEKLSFKYEFLKIVEESDLPDEQKALICRLGIEALKGEELSI